MIKKLQRLDNYVASTRIYKAIDAICNILLVFAVFALVIMAVAQQAQVLTAFNN